MNDHELAAIVVVTAALFGLGLALLEAMLRAADRGEPPTGTT